MRYISIVAGPEERMTCEENVAERRMLTHLFAIVEEGLFRVDLGFEFDERRPVDRVSLDEDPTGPIGHVAAGEEPLDILPFVLSRQARDANAVLHDRARRLLHMSGQKRVHGRGERVLVDLLDVEHGVEALDAAVLREEIGHLLVRVQTKNDLARALPVLIVDDLDVRQVEFVLGEEQLDVVVRVGDGNVTNANVGLVGGDGRLMKELRWPRRAIARVLSERRRLLIEKGGYCTLLLLLLLLKRIDVLKHNRSELEECFVCLLAVHNLFKKKRRCTTAVALSRCLATEGTEIISDARRAISKRNLST